MSPIDWIALGMVVAVPACLLARVLAIAVGRGLIWAFIRIGSPE